MRAPIALRILAKVCKRTSMDKYGTWKWSCQKQSFDFEPTATVEEASAQLIKQYGERPGPGKNSAAYQTEFIHIYSHQMVYEQEKTELPGWQADEQSLFDAMTLKSCLSRKK